MESFTYHNIFETKGIEYLVIIGFFAVLIPFWILLSRRRAGVKRSDSFIRLLSLGGDAVPRGLFFSNSHTWAHMGRDGNVKVGIDGLVAGAAGEAAVAVAAEKGSEIRKGGIIAILENNGRKLFVKSPVSGTVEDINAELLSSPSDLFDDPTGKGWICRITPSDWRNETAAYRLGSETAQWLRNETEKLRDFLLLAASEHYGEAKPVMQDGGEITINPLKDFPEDTWKAFDEKFMAPE
jgi:glycine cleavage system H protein